MKTKYQLISGLIALTVAVSACKKSENSQNDSQPLAEADSLNISYGADSSNKMDVYLPANRTKTTPVVLMLHGGFWIGGDKADLSTYARYFRNQGFAVANINYRLVKQNGVNIHPAQMEDMQKAVQFIVSKASSWSISPEKIGAIGVSSGGHLALLYTYAYNNDDKIKAVVSVAGPTNFTDASAATDFQKGIVAGFLGAPFQPSSDLYAAASPITHVDANTKPTLIIHGKLDVVVPYQHSVDLHNKLDELHVANKLIAVDGAGHEDVINNANMEDLLGEASAWFSTYLE